MTFMKHIRLCFGWLAVAIMVHNEVEAWTFHYRNDSNMDWETARRWCQQNYTDMVAIQNKEEITYLNNTLPHHKQYYWIGLRKVEGQWTWVGTKKPLTEAHWADAEPNNKQSNEDCVEIYIKRDKDAAMWNDEKCSSLSAPLCYKVSCLNTSCSEHAECVEAINNYTCKCEPGFSGPRCEKAVQCSPISGNSSGLSMKCSHPISTNSYNSTCTFSCEEGFELRGPYTTKCDHTGQWTHKTPTCKEQEKDVGTPAAGHLVAINNYTCKCEPGFSGPRCEKAVQCSPISGNSSGLSMKCSHPISTNSYNSTCTFSCEEGFELRGPYTTKCDHTGQWTHKTPTCTAVQCSPISGNSSGLSMKCSHPISTNSYNSTCTFSCEEGFELRGPYTTKCDHTGQWTHKTPTCTAAPCKTPSVLGEGKITCFKGNNTFCTVECSPGHLLLGTWKYTCQHDGLWSDFRPLCIRCDHLLLASTVCCVLSTTCYCILCCSLCRKRKKTVRRQQSPLA
ncbi:L-selectin-like isoform X2 [Pygocentrus nattereri]|uniref:L-selectin-like isoform X2 n=1 Tax=Pygocentrus nattereri TaxID=42514 RepID=UPI0008147126|nr:L-selectin-like isoform X2 [Pygocentrus nattereri]